MSQYSPSSDVPEDSVFRFIDGRAPLQVATRTVITGGVAAGIGSIIGLRRGLPVLPAAFSTALSTSVFAFTFFSTREYLAIPTTRYLNEAGKVAPSSSPHTSNIAQTAVSGAGAGALIAGYARGRSKILPGAVTFALGCSLIQLAMNKLYLARINALSKSQEPVAIPSVSKPAKSESFISRNWPIKKLSDEEYAATLKKQLEECETTIQEIDQETARLKANPHAHKV